MRRWLVVLVMVSLAGLGPGCGTAGEDGSASGNDSTSTGGESVGAQDQARTDPQADAESEADAPEPTDGVSTTEGAPRTVPSIEVDRLLTPEDLGYTTANLYSGSSPLRFSGSRAELEQYFAERHGGLGDADAAVVFDGQTVQFLDCLPERPPVPASVALAGIQVADDSGADGAIPKLMLDEQIRTFGDEGDAHRWVETMQATPLDNSACDWVEAASSTPCDFGDRCFLVSTEGDPSLGIAMYGNSVLAVSVFDDDDGQNLESILAAAFEKAFG